MVVVVAALRVALVAAIVLLPAMARAEDLPTLLGRMLDGHKRLAAARSDLAGSQAGAHKAVTGWYPEARVLADYGRDQNENKAAGQGPIDLIARQVDITLTQPVLDFGKTGAEVDKADLAVIQAANNVTLVRQDLLLEGLTAYVNMRRAHQTMKFAEQSVVNIRRQTGMEESKVELGGGMATDVLQAKSQLAGAEARLTRARGALVTALNRYRAVFGEEPPPQAELVPVMAPLSFLPDSLERAVALAQEHSPQLTAARLTAEVADAEVRRVTRTELLPKVNLIAEGKDLFGAEGSLGVHKERLVKLEFTYPLNLGLAPLDSIDVAKQAVLAADRRAADSRDTIEEQVRDAWQNLATARDTQSTLENQARISEQFLKLAREERLQGHRSLLDVLSGETSLIGAQSDAASAEADVVIAAFTVLRTVGGLDVSLVR